MVKIDPIFQFWYPTRHVPFPWQASRSGTTNRHAPRPPEPSCCAQLPLPAQPRHAHLPAVIIATTALSRPMVLIGISGRMVHIFLPMAPHRHRRTFMNSRSSKLFTTMPSALALSAMISLSNSFMQGPVKFPGDRDLDISTSMETRYSDGEPVIVDTLKDPKFIWPIEENAQNP